MFLYPFEEQALFFNKQKKIGHSRFRVQGPLFHCLHWDSRAHDGGFKGLSVLCFGIMRQSCVTA